MSLHVSDLIVGESYDRRSNSKGCYQITEKETVSRRKERKDKKKTMERLLKKQESKATKSAKVRSNKNTAPVIIYRHSSDGAVIHCPPNFEFPLKPAKIPPPSKPKLCSMGCGNLKSIRVLELVQLYVVCRVIKEILQQEYCNMQQRCDSIFIIV